MVAMAAAKRPCLDSVPRSRRDAMFQLVFLWFVLSMQAFGISMQRGPIDTNLFWRFAHIEDRGRTYIATLLRDDDELPNAPDDDPFLPPPAFAGRHTRMLRFAASFQQLAMTLALILMAFPRAFRDPAQSHAGGLMVSLCLLGGHAPLQISCRAAIRDDAPP